MKIFLMKTASGSYEDYHENIEGAYLSKDNCINAIDKYNSKKELRETMYRTIYSKYNELCYENERIDYYADKFWREIENNIEDNNLSEEECSRFELLFNKIVKDLPNPYNKIKLSDIYNVTSEVEYMCEDYDAFMQEVEVKDVTQ